MIKLRVVGASEDNGQLILSNKPRGRRGSHVVEIDQRMLAVLQDAVYARREAARADRVAEYAAPVPAAPASKIPPREMQRLLRAGTTTAQVAKVAGVDASYVEQFLVPVLYEREGIVREAQALSQEKPRLGASGAPLGDAVVQNLAARHVRLSEEQMAGAWSATRQEGAPWIVTLTFPFRGRSRTARWRFDQRERTIHPLNELARDMGWITPGKRTPTAPQTVRQVNLGEKSAARKSAKKKPAAKRKPAGRKVAAKKRPAGKKRAAAKKPARKPAKKVTKRKPAARKPASRRKAAVRKPATRRKAAPRRKTAARKAAPRRKTAARKKTARRR